MTVYEHLEIESGDIFLVRTGRQLTFLTEYSAEQSFSREPAIGKVATNWMHEHGIAAARPDNWGVEVFPGEYADAATTVHLVLIQDVGMTLSKIRHFESFASKDAAHGIYDFLFCAQLLRFLGTVASPVIPLVLK